MNYPQFPAANELLQLMFDRKVKAMLDQLYSQKTLVDSHREPTNDDIQLQIAKSTDPAILGYLEEIAAIEEDLFRAKETLETYVKDSIYSPVGTDEKEAAKKSFTANRNNLIAYLHSLADTASYEGYPDVVTWANTVLDTLPKLTEKKTNSDVKKARAWLMENMPQLGVKARGPIPIEYLRHYYVAHRD